MENEKRLIDANALVIDLRRAEGFRFDDKMFAVDIVNGQDTVDAVEVVHGRWSFIGENCCVCSVCHKHAIADYYFCPECGAKMDGMEMRKDISKAASIICPMCDEKKCVGRYNCKQIADYMKTKLVDFDHVKIANTHTVELPVKIGQKVYTIPRCAIREWTVVGVWVSVREEYSYVHISWSKSGRIMESRSVNFCDIDKTLYLTREEAESALAGRCVAR